MGHFGISSHIAVIKVWDLATLGEEALTIDPKGVNDKPQMKTKT